jgi:hypothetical protein
MLVHTQLIPYFDIASQDRFVVRELVVHLPYSIDLVVGIHDPDCIGMLDPGRSLHLADRCSSLVEIKNLRQFGASVSTGLSLFSSSSNLCVQSSEHIQQLFAASFSVTRLPCFLIGTTAHPGCERVNVVTKQLPLYEQLQRV